MTYRCTTCGQVHGDLPDIGSDAPDQWDASLVDEPGSSLTGDLCVIEARDYFVRGVIDIPVHDFEHPFGWGVWVSHKQENFEKYRECFHDDGGIGPFFGWLCTGIRYFSEPTVGLKTMAHYQGNGQRPRIVLDDEDHPLCRQQREGISLAEAWRIVHYYAPDLK